MGQKCPFLGYINLEKLLYRILSGKIIVDIEKIYVVHTVSFSHKYWAEKVYERNLAECLAEGVISKEDKMFELMLFRNKLPYDYKTQLKDKQKILEDRKVDLYEAVKEKKTKEAEEIRLNINNITGEVGELLTKMHCLDSITAEGISELEKNKYLLRKSLKKKVSNKTLEEITEWMATNYIKESDYRKIARSNQFFNMISAKSSLFKNHPLTDEQMTLMYWHRFYKGVLRSQEKPFDWVISDDLALDGWYISQSRKTSKSDSISYVESKMSSNAVRNSEEVYIIAPKHMADVIYDANDGTGKAYAKAKFNLIDKGKLNESTEQRLGQGFGIK